MTMFREYQYREYPLQFSDPSRQRAFDELVRSLVIMFASFDVWHLARAAGEYTSFRLGQAWSCLHSPVRQFQLLAEAAIRCGELDGLIAAMRERRPKWVGEFARLDEHVAVLRTAQPPELITKADAEEDGH